jgi:hypothetical protein
MSDRTLQAGVTHQFSFKFYDIYDNLVNSAVVLNPPYTVKLNDVKQTIQFQSFSFQDTADINRQNIVRVFVERSVVNTTTDGN